MNRSKLLVVPALVAAAALVAAPAEAAATHITPKVWHVYTHSDDVKHNVGLGQTYTDCGNPVDEIWLKTRVTNAHKGQSFKELWFLNGVKELTNNDTWNKNGDFTDFFGLYSKTDTGTLPDGTWKVKIRQAGKTLAQSKVTLNTAC